MRVLLLGACGYIGSVLHPLLVSAGYEVTGYDNNPPEKSPHTIINGDIRNLELLDAALEGKDAVIHLAMMSNNDWCNNNPLEADDINMRPFPRFIRTAKNLGVKRFIYASSVAAYGSTIEDVDETHTLRPSTLYGKYKAWCEGWINAVQSESFCCVRVRAASVCGVSPRMRWDITLNKMVHDAQKGAIQVNGGTQKRAHVHILDLCRLYARLLDCPPLMVCGQAFNVVTTNESVMDSALRVRAATGCDIKRGEYTDNRSYTVSGVKVRDVLGWRPALSMDNAINEMRAV